MARPSGKFLAGRIEQEARRLDCITGDHDVFRALVPPLALAMVVDASGPPVVAHLDAPDHRQIADLGAGADRARDPGDQRALLGIGRAAELAEAAIDAGMRVAARRRQSRDRRHRPCDAERLAAARQHLARGVDLVLPVRIARPLRPPRIIDGAGNLQRLLDLGVVVPHHFGIDRPIDRIAELRARLEPLGTAAQRHHLKMYGAAADAPAAIVRAELDRVVAADDAVRPSQNNFSCDFSSDAKSSSGRQNGPASNPITENPYSASLQASVPPPAPVPTIAKSTSSSSRQQRIGEPAAAVQRVRGAPLPCPRIDGAIAHFSFSSIASHGSRRFACIRT